MQYLNLNGQCMCYFSVLDGVRQYLEHEGEEAKDQLKTKIKQLGSEIAELNEVEQQTETHK